MQKVANMKKAGLQLLAMSVLIGYVTDVYTLENRTKIILAGIAGGVLCAGVAAAVSYLNSPQNGKKKNKKNNELIKNIVLASAVTGIVCGSATAGVCYLLLPYQQQGQQPLPGAPNNFNNPNPNEPILGGQPQNMLCFTCKKPAAEVKGLVEFGCKHFMCQMCRATKRCKPLDDNSIAQPCSACKQSNPNPNRPHPGYQQKVCVNCKLTHPHNLLVRFSCNHFMCQVCCLAKGCNALDNKGVLQPCSTCKPAAPNNPPQNIQMPMTIGDCNICATENVALITLPCGHGDNCADCTKQWLSTNPTCPVCRADVTEKFRNQLPGGNTNSVNNNPPGQMMVCCIGDCLADITAAEAVPMGCGHNRCRTCHRRANVECVQCGPEQRPGRRIQRLQNNFDGLEFSQAGQMIESLLRSHRRPRRQQRPINNGQDVEGENPCAIQ